MKILDQNVYASKNGKGFRKLQVDVLSFIKENTIIKKVKSEFKCSIFLLRTFTIIKNMKYDKTNQNFISEV